MKSFQNTSGLLAAASGVLLIALAACLASDSASQAAETATPLATAAWASTVCDGAVCGAAIAADDLNMGANPTAAATLPDSPMAPSSGFSAAAMVALGVAMMTGRIRRKALWGARAPWRPLAAQPG